MFARAVPLSTQMKDNFISNCSCLQYNYFVNLCQVRFAYHSLISKHEATECAVSTLAHRHKHSYETQMHAYTFHSQCSKFKLELSCETSTGISISAMRKFGRSPMSNFSYVRFFTLFMSIMSCLQLPFSLACALHPPSNAELDCWPRLPFSCVTVWPSGTRTQLRWCVLN